MVSATVTAGTNPQAVAVNPVTNQIYVANAGGTVTVIDGATNSTATVTAGTNPQAVAVNPVTNQIYVANAGGTVTVIDGATNSTTTVVAGTNPQAVAVNPVTNQIYIANVNSNTVTVIDGATNSTTTVVAGTNPQAVAVNPVTNKIYAADAGSNTVTVIDGAANFVKTFATGSAPTAVVTNPLTNKIYVANSSSNDVTVIDRAAKTITTVPAGTNPKAVDINLATNKIYVTNNGSNDVTVIDGATDTVAATVTAGSGPRAVAVNPVTDKIYVVNNDIGVPASVTVIDGASNAVTTVTDPNAARPFKLAVNPVTNKIYVTNEQSDNVTVIDGATNTVAATVAAGTGPAGIAVNPVTNKIYVANTSGGIGPYVTVIDGATNTATTVPPPPTVNPPSLIAVGVNPVTNQIYVADNANASVTVIDGATDTILTTVAVGTQPQAVAVNPVTNKIYVANQGSNNVTVIDGATNSTTTVTDPTAIAPFAVAVMQGENKTYVVNQTSNNVTSIKEQVIQTVPLQTAITPLAGNTTSSATPNFSFTASSTFSPNATTPDNLLFQVDTWQGSWTAATNNGGGNFAGGTPALQPGFHALYAYATDGQDATSTEGSSGNQTSSSPLIGNITGYGFLVAAPVFSASPSPLAFGSVSDGVTSAPMMLTVTNTGSANLTISGFTLTGTNAADFTVTSDACTGATVGASGGTCTVAITFTPSIVGAETATLTFNDNAAGSPQAVSLSGTGVAAPAATFSPSSLTFTGQVINTTSAAQQVTLTNTGTAAMTFSGYATSGDFSLTTNTCPNPNSKQTLGIGASCAINVTFTPTVVGADVGSLTITDNAPGSPQSVSLTGIGFSAGVPTASVPSITFASQPVGTTSSPMTFTLSNTGPGPFGNLSVTVSDSDSQSLGTPSQFAQTNNCGSSLAAGSSCTFNVAYAPLTLGTLNGTLTITSDAAGSPLTINLSGSGSPVPFARGDVFVAVANGLVQRRSSTGSLIQVLNTTGGGFTTGMAFDATGNLYATNISTDTVAKFDGSGNPLGKFGGGFASPESIVFDSTGNAYVGNVGGGGIRKFDAIGNLVTVFISGTRVDWMDLAADQKTMLYTQEGREIHSVDLPTGLANPDFATNLGGSAFALRILLDGTVLVANGTNVLHLDSSGKVIQTYNVAGEGSWFALNLDPDGTSFWSANFDTSNVYKFDIQSGNQLLKFNTGTASFTVFGLTVKGEIQAATAADLALTKTASPSPATVNTNLTYTLTATNGGPNSATNVILTDTLPAGVTFVSATPSAGTCSGTATISCNVGTLANAGTATVAIVVTPTAAGSISNTAIVSSDVTDPNSANNTATVTTTVGVGPQLSLSAASLTMPDTPINQTCHPRTLTVTSTGQKPLTISSLAISNAEFTVATNTCPVAPATLSPGASCTVSVVFHPITTGTRTGTLTITSDAPGSPQVVALSGLGLPPCILTAAVKTEDVMRGADSTTFTVYHETTGDAADPVQLSCVNAQPVECSFNPETIETPQRSTMTLRNLRAVSAGSAVVEVRGDMARDHREMWVSVLFSDYFFTTFPNQATVRAGETANYALSLVPVNGLEGQVSLACSGAPAGARCTVTPSVVNASNDAPVQVQLKVETISPSAGGPLLHPPDFPLPAPDSRLLILLGCLAALLLAVLGVKKGCKARDWGYRAAMGLAVLLAMTWASCGGGGMSPPMGQSGGPTAAGSYLIVVSGTFTPAATTAMVSDPSAPPLTHSATVTLNVQ